MKPGDPRTMSPRTGSTALNDRGHHRIPTIGDRSVSHEAPTAPAGLHRRRTVEWPVFMITSLRAAFYAVLSTSGVEWLIALASAPRFLPSVGARQHHGAVCGLRCPCPQSDAAGHGLERAERFPCAAHRICRDRLRLDHRPGGPSTDCTWPRPRSHRGGRRAHQADGQRLSWSPSQSRGFLYYMWHCGRGRPLLLLGVDSPHSRAGGSGPERALLRRSTRPRGRRQRNPEGFTASLFGLHSLAHASARTSSATCGCPPNTGRTSSSTCQEGQGPACGHEPGRPGGRAYRPGPPHPAETHRSAGIPRPRRNPDPTSDAWSLVVIAGVVAFVAWLLLYFGWSARPLAGVPGPAPVDGARGTGDPGGRPPRAAVHGPSCRSARSSSWSAPVLGSARSPRRPYAMAVLPIGHPPLADWRTPSACDSLGPMRSPELLRVAPSWNDWSEHLLGVAVGLQFGEVAAGICDHDLALLGRLALIRDRR